MARISGRTDDMLIIRGVNVFPSQIEELILHCRGLAPHYEIEVTRPNRLDEISIVVEARAELEGHAHQAQAQLLASKLKDNIGISAAIRVAASGSLPRSAGKAAASRTGDRRRRVTHFKTAAVSPRISAALLMALLAGGWLSIARGADPAPPPEELEELVVNGDRTGPGLWHVHHGDAQLWILGSMSPLPKGITWRSKQVEDVLGSTSQVLVQKPFDIGVARIVWLVLTERSLFLLRGGKRLKDVMPAALHESLCRAASQIYRRSHQVGAIPSADRGRLSAAGCIPSQWGCRHAWTWARRCARSRRIMGCASRRSRSPE